MFPQDLAAALSGGLIGLTLGLIGGGGSILAVPLLLYVVGISDPHRAIGTAALAVAANALAALIPHARSGRVKWPCATAFAMSGAAGAQVGAWIGKQIDGQKLLGLFALAMIAVGINMLRRADHCGNPDVRMTPRIAARLIGLGLITGMAAGLFGIGGGFLILPGLVFGAGMAALNAVASSLVGVFALGLSSAASYAASGYVDWRIAGFLIAGGAIGAIIGQRASRKLAANNRVFSRFFALLLFAVAAYMLLRSAQVLGWL